MTVDLLIFESIIERFQNWNNFHITI